MMKFFLKVLFVCSFIIQFGHAQQANKTHIVKKGETIYQIGRIYNVSPKKLLELNPNASEGIYINDVIILPTSIAETAKNTSTYRVKPGDTKYSLSKRFGISINALENENPHIKNGLQPGHLVKIANNQNLEPISLSNSETSLNYSKSIPYKIKKGETLYSISQANNLTVNQLKNANKDIITDVLTVGATINIPVFDNLQDSNTYIIKKGDTKYNLSKRFNKSILELENANPDIKSALQIGSTIVIPNGINSKVEESNKENVVQINTPTEDPNKITTETETSIEVNKIPEISNQAIVKSDVYNSLTKTVDKSKQNKVLLFTPFTKTQFENFTNNPAEFQSLQNNLFKQNVEFHRGALMAIDSIKSLGFNSEIKISALENSNLKNKVSDAINANAMRAYDGIVLPFYLNKSELIASLVKADNIPVITTYAEKNKDNLSNLFEALPSPNIQRLKTLEYLKTQNANYIVIADSEQNKNKIQILEKLPRAKYLKLNANGSFDEDNLISMLDKNQKNYIVLESAKSSVLISSTNLLLRVLSSYKIELAILEQSLMPDISKVSSRRLKILKMVYPSLSKTSLAETPNYFKTQYRNTYNSDVTINVLLGFDIIYDSLIRLLQFDNFDETVQSTKSRQLYLVFDYKQNGLGRFSNNNIIIKQYDKDSDGQGN